MYFYDSMYFDLPFKQNFHIRDRSGREQKRETGSRSKSDRTTETQVGEYSYQISGPQKRKKNSYNLETINNKESLLMHIHICVNISPTSNVNSLYVQDVFYSTNSL